MWHVCPLKDPCHHRLPLLSHSVCLCLCLSPSLSLSSLCVCLVSTPRQPFISPKNLLGEISYMVWSLQHSLSSTPQGTPLHPNIGACDLEGYSIVCMLPLGGLATLSFMSSSPATDSLSDSPIGGHPTQHWQLTNFSFRQCSGKFNRTLTGINSRVMVHLGFEVIFYK